MRGVLRRIAQTSAPDTLQTLSTPTGSARRLLQVLVSYSAAPTYTGTDLKVTLNSGEGAAHDNVLQTGSNNGQYFNYVPDGELILKEDDRIDVVAPAGGGVITSSVTIYTQLIAF